MPFRLFVISRRHNEGAITKRRKRKDEKTKTKRRKRKDESLFVFSLSSFSIFAFVFSLSSFRLFAFVFAPYGGHALTTYFPHDILNHVCLSYLYYYLNSCLLKGEYFHKDFTVSVY